MSSSGYPRRALNFDSPQATSSSSGGSPRSERSSSSDSPRSNRSSSPQTGSRSASPGVTKVMRVATGKGARSAATSTGSRRVTSPRRSIRAEIESLSPQVTPKNIATLKRLLAHYEQELEVAIARITAQRNSTELTMAQVLTEYSATQNPERSPQKMWRELTERDINVRTRPEEEVNDINFTISRLRAVLSRSGRPEDFRTFMMFLKDHLMSLPNPPYRFPSL